MLHLPPYVRLEHWREFHVPGTDLWQLFVYDPSGTQLELTSTARWRTAPRRI